jgi:hypothetical protein
MRATRPVPASELALGPSAQGFVRRMRNSCGKVHLKHIPSADSSADVPIVLADDRCRPWACGK